MSTGAVDLPATPSPVYLRGTRRTVLVAAIVALTALAVGLQLQVDAERNGRLSADERAYLMLATDLEQHLQYGDPAMKQPFRWAPATPVLFAASAALRGRSVSRQLALDDQVVAGALIVPAAGLLGLLLAGPVAAVAAAAAAAAYVPLARAGATAGTETLGALAIVLAGLAIVWATRTGPPGPARLGRYALAGAALGLAALVRADLVAVSVLVAAGLGLVAGRAVSRRRRLAASAVALAGALALMAPWCLYASRHAHRFVPVTDGGAANLFIGTDLPAGGSLFGVKRQFAREARRVHPGLRHVRTYRLPQQLVLDAVAARYPGRSRDAALMAAARANLRRYALGRPLAFAGMELRKLWRMWGSAYAGTGRPAPPGLSWEHRVLALLGLLGLGAGALVVRDRGLVALGALVALTTLVDVAFVSESRHNVRLTPLVLAAGAAGWLLLVRYRATRTVAAPSTTTGHPSPPQVTRESSP
jgi:hypothetical protein